jgi:spore maturation protein SpmA
MTPRRLIHVLWPAFIVAGAMNVVFFTVFDPMELSLFGHAASDSRLAVYTVGFFCFWVMAAASSGLTCFFQRSAAEINQCPLEPETRPPGCPKREDPQADCG